MNKTVLTFSLFMLISLIYSIKITETPANGWDRAHLNCLKYMCEDQWINVLQNADSQIFRNCMAECPTGDLECGNDCWINNSSDDPKVNALYECIFDCIEE